LQKERNKYTNINVYNTKNIIGDEKVKQLRQLAKTTDVQANSGPFFVIFLKGMQLSYCSTI